jgi:hypothetical protein
VVIKTLILDPCPASLEMLDPVSLNLYPQHCFFAVVLVGSTPSLPSAVSTYILLKRKLRNYGRIPVPL